MTKGAAIGATVESEEEEEEDEGNFNSRRGDIFTHAGRKPD